MNSEPDPAVTARLVTNWFWRLQLDNVNINTKAVKQWLKKADPKTYPKGLDPTQVERNQN